MESYELTEYANVDVDKLPQIIHDQFKALDIAKHNVVKATDKANEAKKSAQKTKEKGAGLFQKKEAIESLQGVVDDLADAEVAAAEAQKVLFQYQQALTEMTKFLLALGVSNIAANRCIVRELELKLKGASQEQLDDLARQEIVGVIKQLKAQEDIMMKQNVLTDRVKGHDSRIGVLEYQSEINSQKIEKQIAYESMQDERIKQNTKKGEELRKRDDAQDAELKRQAEKDSEHDKRLEAGDKKDTEQDAEIKRQAEKDSEHDKRLDAGDQKDKSQDEELARQALKDTEHDKRLDEAEQKDKAQDEELARQTVKNTEQDEQIKVLEDKVAALENTCNQLSETIKALDTNHINNETELRAAIDSRFTHRASVASAIVGALGLIIAIISFFL